MRIYRVARPSPSFSSRLLNRISRVLALFMATTLVACGTADRDDLDEIRAMQADGRLAESVDRLRELVEGGDRRAEVLYRYGRGLTALGEIGRAVWALDAVIGDPDYAVPAAKALAVNAIRGRNFELALATLDRLRAEQTDAASEDDVQILILEARALLESRRHYDRALEVVEKILEIDPEREDAQRYRVLALLGNRQSDEAYEAIRAIADAETSEADESPDRNADQTDPYWCGIASSFHRESGNIEMAREVVEECLERFPSALGLIDEAIKIYTIQQKSGEALAVLRAAFDAEPENAQIRVPLVLQLRAMGRYTDAEAVIRGALEREAEKEFPDSADLANLWSDLGRFLIDREKLDEGLAAFDEVTALVGDAVSPDFLFAQAEAMIRVGRYDEALQIADTTTIDVHRPMIRGRIAFERGDFETAREELESAAKVWPNNAPIRYYLARSAEGLGEFNQAIEEYRQAIRSDRAIAAPRVRLGQIHLAEDRVVQAAIMMSFASPKENALASVESKLVTAEIQARSGVQIDLQNLPRDSKQSAEEVLSSVVRAVSRGLRARAGPEAAEQWLGSLSEKSGGHLQTFLFRERILNLIESGQIENAVKRARTRVADHPEDIQARMALALALREEDAGLEEARTLLVDAIVERPYDPVALTRLGEVEGLRGEPEPALTHFEAALSLAPKSPEAILGLARALDALGRRSEAVARLESFLTRDNPIAGRAALQLALFLEKSDATEDRRIKLGLRALRFGAGQSAIDLLKSIDPIRFETPETTEEGSPSAAS